MLQFARTAMTKEITRTIVRGEIKECGTPCSVCNHPAETKLALVDEDRDDDDIVWIESCMMCEEDVMYELYLKQIEWGQNGDD